MEHLTKFQQDVLNDCIVKGSGGLSLPMGSGKSLISLCLSLYNIEKDGSKVALVVASKTLLSSWENEIKKFYGDTLKYLVYHQEKMSLNITELPEEIQLVITTPHVIAKLYKEYHIEDHFVTLDIINQGEFNQHTIKRYKSPTKPFLKPNSLNILYNTNWNTIIIDEIQDYTNIDTYTCKGICSIYSKYRWGISGTILNEPKVERILGYHLLIADHSFPKTLPAAKEYMLDWNGLNKSLVIRYTNDNYTEPKLNTHIIEHSMTNDEYKVYTMMKGIINEMYILSKKYKAAKDIENTRTFNSGLLGMILYLRQSIVVPALPLASALLDLSDMSKKTLISEFINKYMRDQGLYDYLDSEEASKSSRVKELIKITGKHKKCILFSSFRSVLNLIQVWLQTTNKQIFCITDTMSIEQRNRVITDFKDADEGILLLTFSIGAQGLNLQFCDTVVITDYWWNCGVTKQAIARINRYGQNAKELNIYFLTSNTGIEKAILNKNKQKMNIIDELMVGKASTKLATIKVKDIIKLINDGDNTELVQNIFSK